MNAVAAAPLLTEALAYLIELNAGRAEPATAQRRLHELRRRHADARLRLVWQREEYDGSLQYDLLITRTGLGTVSLSHCPDRALPWAFRGGHRVSERLLLRVDGVDMELDHAIACLDFLWDEAPLADRLVTACLLRQELEHDPVELGEEELQDAMDAFRRARGLLTAEATRQWMTRHCLSHRDLEDLVAGEAAVARLRQRMCAGGVEQYFAAHRRALDSARIARLTFALRTDAERMVAEIHADADFYAAAERQFAAGTVSTPGGVFHTVRREDLEPALAEQVFDASTGTLIGPWPTSDGHAVIRLLARDPAVLDAPTADLIERRLFAAWLEERRQSARVEWFWGNTARSAAENTTEAGTTP